MFYPRCTTSINDEMQHNLSLLYDFLYVAYFFKSYRGGTDDYNDDDVVVLCIIYTIYDVEYSCHALIFTFIIFVVAAFIIPCTVHCF